MTPDYDAVLGHMALGLDIGGTLREICPKCGGGTHKEKSLSVSLDDSGYMLWKCWRASCGFSGRRLLWGVVQDYASRPKKLGKTFTGLLEPLSDVQISLIKEAFGIHVYKHWRWAPEYSRIRMPIFGPKGENRGCILRTLPGSDIQPKTLTFKENYEDPWMHWSGPPKEGLIPVIVEDMFSAANLQQSNIPSICLLGTHLSLDKVREIVSYYPEAVLALDKDAYEKAVGYAGTFRHLIGLKVWKLEKDLKYVSSDRIREAYYNNKTDFTLERETTTISRNPLP